MAGFLAISVLAAAAPGCGGDEEGKQGSEAKRAAEPKGDPRPRVEGRWRALYIPQEPDREQQRTTWTVTSSCDAGACSFRALSNGGSRFRFRFDRAIGDYTADVRYTEDCANEATGDVLAKDAYRVKAQMTLDVTTSVRTSKGTYATELFGTRVDRLAVTPQAEAAGCELGTTTNDSMRVVRIDPPAGKKVMNSPGGTGVGGE